MASIAPSTAHAVAAERVRAQMAANDADFRKARTGDSIDNADQLLYLEAWRTVEDLLGNQRELERLMSSAEREFEQARRYCRGESAAMNSLGILQGNGVRIDVLVALIHAGVDRAISAERRVVEHEATLDPMDMPSDVRLAIAADLESGEES